MYMHTVYYITVRCYVHACIGVYYITVRRYVHAYSILYNRTLLCTCMHCRILYNRTLLFYTASMDQHDVTLLGRKCKDGYISVFVNNYLLYV